MTKEEESTERIIFAALLRAASEQSTYLTGTMKFQMSQDFKNLVRRMDQFVNDAVSKMESQPGGLQYFEDITDCYHNINIELRKNMNIKYKTLRDAESAEK